MRVVIDEGVPRHLVQELRKAGFDAHRFQAKWAGRTNGDLIEAVEAEGFVVLVTNDKNIVHQQSLAGRNLAVVALSVNKRRVVIERIRDIVDTIHRSRQGQHAVISIDGSRTTKTVVDGDVIVEELPPVPPFQW